MAKTPLQELADHGQSVWIDYLSRPFVQDGDLAELVERRRRGRHLQPDDLPGRHRRGRRYDDQIREIVEGGETEPKEIFLALAARRHPRRLRRAERPSTRPATARTATCRSRSTRTSRTTPRRTIEEAKRLSRARRPATNLFIKIPATKEGLPAIEETIAAGIPVNVTLIFSLERHREVAEAYVRGLQRLADARRRPRPSSPPWPRSSSPASTPRATSASTRSAATTSSRASSRSPTPSSPTSTYQEIFSGARVGGARGQGRDRRSAACGRRPRPRTPSTAT